MTHTPGPWQQKHDHDREGMLTIIGNVDGEYVDGVPECTYTTICEVEDNADGLDNAQLIAALPDLVETLRHIAGMGYVAEPGTVFQRMARAALEKAGAK